MSFRLSGLAYQSDANGQRADKCLHCRAQVGSGINLRIQIKKAVFRAAHKALGLSVQAYFQSAIDGGDGNREFFVHSTRQLEGKP